MQCVFCSPEYGAETSLHHVFPLVGGGESLQAPLPCTASSNIPAGCRFAFLCLAYPHFHLYQKIGASLSLSLIPLSFAEGPLFVPVLGAGNIIFFSTSLISQAEQKEVNYSVDHILTVMGWEADG